MKRIACAVLLVMALGAASARAETPPAPPAEDGDDFFAGELFGGEAGFELDAVEGEAPDPGGPMMGGGPGMAPGMGHRMGAGMGHGRAPGMGVRNGDACPMPCGPQGMMGCGMGSGSGPAGRGPGLMGMRGALLEKLELTDAQREKFAELRDARMRAAIHARADLALAGLDLARLVRAQTPDRAAIDAAIDHLSELRGALQKARVDMLLDMRSMLTPAQRQKLREWRGPAAPRAETPARPPARGTK